MGMERIEAIVGDNKNKNGGAYHSVKVIRTVDKLPTRSGKDSKKK